MAGLREALEDKFEELDAPEPEAEIESAPVEEAAAPEEAEPVEAAPARDESGKFVKNTNPAGKALTSPAGSAGQGTTVGAAAPAVAPPVVPALSPFKPPQSWKAGAREHWGTLSPDVQAEIDRREKEIAKALQTSAEKAKGSEGWTEAIRPYEAQIRANGGNPQQYVGQLLQTAHALTYGHNKADVLADIIMQFQVPPDALDKALVARMTGGQRQAPQPQQLQDPRLDKLLASLEEQRASQDKAASEEADAAIESFSQEEFFHDVADTMADLIDTWKAKGKQFVTEADLKRAYDIACQMDENVSSVMARRKAATSAGTVNAATQRAKNAASSIKSQPTGAASAPQPTGRRAALEAAYEAANGE